MKSILMVVILGGIAAGCGTQEIDGAERYAALCATCHGSQGEGGSAPRLDRWALGEKTLAKIIGTQMPKDDPSLCRGKCPPAVARYIIDVLVMQAAGGGMGNCTDEPTQPRRVRLLSRAEYRATMQDLFGPPSPTTPTTPTTPCGETTFTFDPHGQAHTTVHVAGTFNNWAGTVAGGGWAMTLANGMWSTTRTLPVGQSQYKFVLDQSQWIADPQNAKQSPDGLGGQNSVIDVAQCPPPNPMGQGAIPDVAATFPAEIRPDSFPYDDHADAQVVTTVHVQEYLSAAKRVAAVLAKDSSTIATLLSCNPAAQKSACVDALTGPLGTRVFRRPLNADEQKRYRDLANKSSEFTVGVRTALAAMLSSPGFLYRSELGTAQPDGTFKLDGWEIASELSYLFWGSMPDAALFEAARTGALDGDAGIDQEARRLLADARSRARLGQFALQWLGAENILTVDKQAQLFPELTPGVRAQMAEETRRFVAHVVFDGTHAFEELFTADYSFVDGALAKVYGMNGPTGSALEKAQLPEERRAGLLAQASILSTYGHSDQTSPILRGLFVRRRILCQDLPPPPPNGGMVPDVDPTATTRERFFQHTANPACASCHQYIDSVGFGFERFDSIGRYRTMENGKPIDASGDMNDVEKLGSETSAPFSTLPELARVIVKSDRARQCFSRQYYAFARGVVPPGEGCAPASLMARFQASGFDVRELMIGVTAMSDFRVRK